MKKSNLLQVSFLIACGSALQLAESFIPFPIPGMRIGLANVSTLLGIVMFGPVSGLEIAIFRPVITSLTNGTFLAPGFILSFFGSIASYGVMSGIYYATRRHKVFSLIGISILGAIAHNITQIFLAYYWLIPHAGVLALAPILVISGLVGGYFVGWACEYVMEKVREKKDALPNIAAELKPAPERKPLEASDKAKIIAAFGFVISTIFLKTITSYLILIAIVFFLVLISDQKISLVFKKAFRLWGVILFSFLLPILFTPAGKIFFKLPLVTVTDIGVYQGILFGMRVVFLILISIWIGVTEPEKLSEELAWLLSPLKVFGIPVGRIPRIISVSMSFLPLVWEKLKSVKPKKIKSVLDMLVALLVGLESK